MKVKDIPFADLVGIEQDGSELSLSVKDEVLNHLKTIHAGAQFSLAETQSGIYLQALFPELAGKVVPILRDGQIKYKKPAQEKIFAFSSCSEESKEKFQTQFDKKGRATLQVDVDVKDINGVITSQATFTWFIQAL